MKVALDTNILVYGLGFDDETKQQVCLALLRDLRDKVLSRQIEALVPIQVFMELHHVLRHKKRLTIDECDSKTGAFMNVFRGLATTSENFRNALEIVRLHHLQIFDATILAVCADNGCSVLFSEDMQNQFRWKTCRIINPLNYPGGSLTVDDWRSTIET